MSRFFSQTHRLVPRGAVLALACLLVVAPPASAQMSTRPIKVVIPFAPGGAQDAIGRHLSVELSSRLGVPVIVENKAGAGGIIAADFVAKAPPDGTTLLLATGGAISIAPHLTQKLPYRAQRDLTPIALIADTPMVIAVRSDSNFRTLADLIKAAKAQPGQVTFASTGNGTVSNLTGELFAQATGIKLSHIPYKGAAPATVDLLSGQVAAMVTTATSIEPMVNGRKARVLATFTVAPLPNFPGVPTVKQAVGVPGLEVPVWVGLMAPAQTPSSILRKLSSEVMTICQLPETQRRLRESGAVSTCEDSIEFGRLIAEDSQRWERVIRSANIKSE